MIQQTKHLFQFHKVRLRHLPIQKGKEGYMFQFHKVRLRLLQIFLSFSVKSFQFHKVRLRLYIKSSLSQLTTKFQFHKVRLRLLYAGVKNLRIYRFNSIKYD